MVFLRIKIVGCFGSAMIGLPMSFSVLKAPLGMTKSKFAIGLKMLGVFYLNFNQIL
jgi:hypothetical protein